MNEQGRVFEEDDDGLTPLPKLRPGWMALEADRIATLETKAERRDRIKATVAVVILALFVGIVIGAARERVLAHRAAFTWSHHVVAEDDGYGQP